MGCRGSGAIVSMAAGLCEAGAGPMFPGGAPEGERCKVADFPFRRIAVFGRDTAFAGSAGLPVAAAADVHPWALLPGDRRQGFPDTGRSASVPAHCSGRSDSVL